MSINYFTRVARHASSPTCALNLLQASVHLQLLCSASGNVAVVLLLCRFKAGFNRQTCWTTAAKKGRELLPHGTVPPNSPPPQRSRHGQEDRFVCWWGGKLCMWSSVCHIKRIKNQKICIPHFSPKPFGKHLFNVEMKEHKNSYVAIWIKFDLLNTSRSPRKNNCSKKFLSAATSIKQT